MKTLLYTCFLSVLLLTLGCETENSADVNQDRIYTAYELYYNQNEDVTYAWARFRFGNALGTLLELTAPSTVSFDGQELAWRPLLAYYELRLPGKISMGSFRFEDTDGNVYENSLEFREIAYNDSTSHISKGAAYAYFWEGAPLSMDEHVSLTINGNAEGDARIFRADNVGDESVLMTVNKMENFPSGQAADCWLDRHYEPIIQQAPAAGGKLTGRYRPINQEITFD